MQPSERELLWYAVHNEWGAGTRGASLGPASLRIEAVKQHATLFERYPWQAQWPELLVEDVQHAGPPAKSLVRILEFFRQSVNGLLDVLQAGRFPLVLAGDHAHAAASLAALRRSQPEARIGVMWIDAHADIHTPWTSPSGNVHGMPLGAALDLPKPLRPLHEVDPANQESWSALCSLGGANPWIYPQDLVYIGVRELEYVEWVLLQEMDILHFTPEELQRIGVDAVLARTFERLAECTHLYCTFDIDSLDGFLVPGTGTPVADGLSVVTGQALLNAIWQDPRLSILEMAELNPLLDVRGQTVQTAFRLLSRLLAV